MEFGDTALPTAFRTALRPDSGISQYLDTAKLALLLTTAPAEQPSSKGMNIIRINVPVNHRGNVMLS